MAEWFDDPAARAWLRRAKRDLVPKMRESQIVLSLYNGEPDAKLAVETGFAVLLDKPIIGLVTPGCTPSAKFVAICDELIEADMDHDINTAEGRASVQARLTAAMKRLGLES